MSKTFESDFQSRILYKQKAEIEEGKFVKSFTLGISFFDYDADDFDPPGSPPPGKSPKKPDFLRVLSFKNKDIKEKNDDKYIKEEDENKPSKESDDKSDNDSDFDWI